ncbi:hypothetical protein CL647_04835 [bacterium]|nr:hypothetical protein [bacterium]|tara:strand:+ start:344 stop:1507 length:1164 start_codon:yes stop_codon:yes gene_type:complete
MINKNIHIAIIGGGIGGLVVAIALHQKGFNPVVYEQAKSIHPIGAGIVLSTNAMNALNKIGVAKEVVKLGSPVHKFQLQNSKGRPLYTTNFDELETKYGFPAIGISRTDLQQVLLQRIPNNSIYLDHHLELINDHYLKFKERRSIKPDLVIGADGLHSNLRHLLFKNISLRYSGQTGWRGLGFLPKHSKLNSFFESWGRGRRFGAVQINEKQVYWYVGLNAPSGSLPIDGVESKNKILSLFKDWHDPITELVKNTPLHCILPTDIYDLKPSRTWVKDNVVLLGDSIHATTPNLGQGAGMAIESALTLAYCLSENSDLKDAFTQYQSLRQKRTAWVTSQSWIWGKVSQANGNISCYLRDTLLSFSSNFIPKVIEKKHINKLLGYQVDF